MSTALSFSAVSGKSLSRSPLRIEATPKPNHAVKCGACKNLPRASSGLFFPHCEGRTGIGIYWCVEDFTVDKVSSDQNTALCASCILQVVERLISKGCFFFPPFA